MKCVKCKSETFALFSGLCKKCHDDIPKPCLDQSHKRGRKPTVFCQSKWDAEKYSKNREIICALNRERARRKYGTIKGKFVVEKDGMFYSKKRSNNKLRLVPFFHAHTFTSVAFALRAVGVLGGGVIMERRNTESETREEHIAAKIKASTMNNEKHDSAGSSEPDCSAPFSARLDVTDGGEPLELYENDGIATIERGENNVVAEGENLYEAWDCYLLESIRAPVKDAELAAMWVLYDKQNAPPLSERACER